MNYMNTLEELTKRTEELKARMETLRAEEKSVSDEMQSVWMEIQSINMNYAMKHSPFNWEERVLVDGMPHEVSYMEMCGDELHIVLSQLTKKGLRNLRTYPKHLYIKVADMPLEEYRTVNNELVTR